MKHFVLTAALAGLIATGANAQVASTIVLAEGTAPAASTATHDIFTDNEMIMVVIDRGSAAVPVGQTTMDNIVLLCENGGTMTLDIGDGVPVTNQNNSIRINGTDSGYNCPLPATVGPYATHVQKSWAMHRGHGNGEFTDEHLRAVLTEMRDHPMGEFITRNDIPSGYRGNDRQYVDRSLEQSVTGQLQGWKVIVDEVFYLVVRNNCLEICTGEAVTWHLHKQRARAVTPRVSTPRVSTPAPAPAPAITVTRFSLNHLSPNNHRWSKNLWTGGTVAYKQVVYTAWGYSFFGPNERGVCVGGSNSRNIDRDCYGQRRTTN